jgi:hypothetical protein
MIIYKKPLFEDDSYMFVLEETDRLAEISLFDLEYYNTKREMFNSLDSDKMHLSDFVHRPSLRMFDEVINLSGSIYTLTCEDKNDMSYSTIITAVKCNYKTSRRCTINFADTLRDYIDDSINTSCLNAIHYYKDNVTLYFRASDMKNELLIDLHLIKEFFIKPVGHFKTITVVASTAQNIIKFNNLITNNYELKQ